MRSILRRVPEGLGGLLPLGLENNCLVLSERTHQNEGARCPHLPQSFHSHSHLNWEVVILFRYQSPHRLGVQLELKFSQLQKICTYFKQAQLSAAGCRESQRPEVIYTVLKVGFESISSSLSLTTLSSISRRNQVTFLKVKFCISVLRVHKVHRMYVQF